MASASFFLIAAFVGLVGRSVVGQSNSGSSGEDCKIPDGQFNGMIEDVNTMEPYYGSRCVVKESVLVQVRKRMCMPFYCCDEPCICGSFTLVETQAQLCKNGSEPQKLSCYVARVEYENFLYGCCAGSVEDIFHVCTSIVECKVNNGGCDQRCQHNVTSDQDYCDCIPGYQRRLLDSNGTSKCMPIGNGSFPSSDVPSTATTTKTTASTPALGAVSSGRIGLPIPYIIAIAFALTLLLLLLLLLIMLLCRRRRKAEEKKSVFVISSFEKKIPPFKDIESGKKKFDDDDKDNMAATATVKCRRENDYSEDPVAVNGSDGNESGRGQGHETDDGLHGYESMNFTNKVESNDGTYEELEGYTTSDEHPYKPVD